MRIWMLLILIAGITGCATQDAHDDYWRQTTWRHNYGSGTRYPFTDVPISSTKNMYDFAKKIPHCKCH